MFQVIHELTKIRPAGNEGTPRFYEEVLTVAWRENWTAEEIRAALNYIYELPVPLGDSPWASRVAVSRGIATNKLTAALTRHQKIRLHDLFNTQEDFYE